MRSRALSAVAAPLIVIGAVLVTFAVFDDPFRGLETHAAVALLHVLGVSPDAVQMRAPAGIAVFPGGSAPFLAIVTPSCSALGSVLAIAFLSVFVPPRNRRRLPAALAAALLLVVVGNVVRIACSVAVGLAIGADSLVLFHDWVGSLFAYAYTLGGYLLMLFVLLPVRPAAEVVDREPVEARRSGTRAR